MMNEDFLIIKELEYYSEESFGMYNEKVILETVVEKNGGTVIFDEKTGITLATIEDTSLSFKGEIVSGIPVIYAYEIYWAFAINGVYLEEQNVLLNRTDYFYSTDAAALAWSYKYLNASINAGIEMGAWIYENISNGYFWGELINGQTTGIKDFWKYKQYNEYNAGWIHSHGNQTNHYDRNFSSPDARVVHENYYFDGDYVPAYLINAWGEGENFIE